jgi:pimeloyl-ACP methyl ester carboxylesterase
MRKGFVALALLVLLGVLGSILFFYLRPISVISWMKRRDLAKAGFTRRVLETSSGPQVRFEAGAGPTVVLLHGAGDNAGTWAEVAPELAKSYRVLVLDLPGHGESAPAAGPLKMETVLGGMEAVLAAQPAPLTLVGNSLGGWVAMLYARNNPGRVLRVIAVDGGPVIGQRPDLARVPATRADAAKIWDAVLDPGSPRIPGFILDDVVRESQRGAIGRMAAAGDMQKFLLGEAEMASYPAPVDLLWGESDRLVPLEYAKTMEAQLPAVRLTTVPRCGHIPQAECPRTFTAALEKALQEAPPRPHATQAAPEAKGKK